MIAIPVLRRIEQLDPERAAAVNRAIDNIGTETGVAIDLPNGDPANPYLALRSRHPDAPLVIYRRARQDEDSDFLVVSLMSPEEYRQQQADERSGLFRDPAVREEIRVVAGTAAAAAVRAIPGFGGSTSPDDPQT